MLPKSVDVAQSQTEKIFQTNAQKERKSERMVLKMMKDEKSWINECNNRKGLEARCVVDIVSAASRLRTDEVSICDETTYDLHFCEPSILRDVKRDAARELMERYPNAICMLKAERNLSEVLLQKDIREFPTGYTRQLLLEIGEVIGTLHDNNVVHGDIKPRNIVRMATSRFSSKYMLIDLDTFSLVTNSGKPNIDPAFFKEKVRKSNAYVPPEIMQWSKSPEGGIVKTVHPWQRVDLWSYGAIMFEVLAGTPLFCNAQDMIDERTEGLLLLWRGLTEDHEKQIKRHWGHRCNSG